MFDTTVQESNVWLKSVMDHLHTDDRHLAYLALRRTLHPDPLHLDSVLPLPIAPRLNCPVPVAFSADGGRLAAGSDTAVIWDMNTRREVFRLVPDAEGKIGGEPAWIDGGFAFRADGRAILTTHEVWAVPDPAAAPRS